MMFPIFSSSSNNRIRFEQLAVVVLTWIGVVTSLEMRGFAATPVFRWAVGASPVLNNYRFGTNTTPLAVDSEGNSFLFGSFGGTIMSGANFFVSRGSYDLLVSKYDRTGTLTWTKRVGGEGTETGFGITTDEAGNSLVTGFSRSTNADFGEITLTNLGTGFLFLVKFDPNGNAIWASKAGGNYGPLPTGIATDRLGNCYVTGNLGPQIFVFGSIVITNTQASSAFLAKYDSQGGPVWVRTGLSSSIGDRVAADKEGTVYWLGEEWVSSGLYQWFWARFDASGNALSRTRIGGGSGYVLGQSKISMALDSTGHAYFSGTFYGTNLDFGGRHLTNHGATFRTDAFVAKCNTNGNALWVRTLGGTASDSGAGIAVDGEDNCYVVGSFSSADSDIGGISVSGRGGFDVVAAKFDPFGNPVWLKLAGGTQDDVGVGVGLDKMGNCYVAGICSGTASFDSIQTTTPGPFLAKIVDPPPVNISRIGQQSLIYWPANKDDFVLESSAGLLRNSKWSTVTSPVAVIGNQRMVLDDFLAGQRFYRLRE